MVIYIHSMFHQIPLIGFVVMTLDGCDRWMEEQTDEHGQNFIPLPSAGDNQKKKLHTE